MKKSVIKRRKRVPAAGPIGRLSDQAAAEALVSVGRGVHSGPGEDEDESEEQEAPKRKRARRTKRAGGKGKGDKGQDDEEGGESSGREAQAWEMQVDRPSAGLMHHPFASPHPHGGFDLPPLNAALEMGGPMAPGYASAPGGKGAFRDVHGHPSYLRSGSGAPSRTHSPLSGPANAVPPYAPMGMPGMMMGGYGFPRGHSPVMLSGVPTAAELERHYFELHEQRRGLVEMLEKTDRIMAGVKRGIEEMRAGGSDGQQQGQQQQGSPNGPAPSVPLQRSASGSGSARESVWPVSVQAEAARE